MLVNYYSVSSYWLKANTTRSRRVWMRKQCTQTSGIRYTFSALSKWIFVFDTIYEPILIFENSKIYLKPFPSCSNVNEIQMRGKFHHKCLVLTHCCSAIFRKTSWFISKCGSSSLNLFFYRKKNLIFCRLLWRNLTGHILFLQKTCISSWVHVYHSSSLNLFIFLKLVVHYFIYTTS